MSDTSWLKSPLEVWVATPLADQLFNPQRVAGLASALQHAWSGFPTRRFSMKVNGRLMDLKLKERIDWIAQCLADALPTDFRRATTVLIDALPQPCDPNLSDDDFGDFIYAPIGAFIAAHGCTVADHLFSLDALHEVTTRFSAEDAIRPFINAFPDVTLATMLRWAEDDHYHVRRLASEGSRPLLPWARRLTVPPTAGLPILHVLAADPTRFVTRSVANHLNDIAKLEPDVVIDTLGRWHGESRHDPAELAFITRHATRTLVKQGNPDALELVGIRRDLAIDVTRFDVPTTVRIGEDLEFSVLLQSASAGEAIVDYAVTFQDARGRMSRRKVFKLRRLTLDAGVPVELRKAHPIRADLTTYRVYPGAHRLELIVNGEVREVREVDVVVGGTSGGP